jgi:hypothetical protein
MVTLDTRDQRLYLSRVQVIDLHGDPFTAGLLDEVGCFLNRFRTVQLGSLCTGGSAGAIHRGAGRTQFDGNAAARRASCACHQHYFAF